MLKYIHLKPDASLPDSLNLELFKAVVVIEHPVSPVSVDWQGEVSASLIRKGCCL